VHKEYGQLHVFMIHSSITFIVANAIIKELNLEDKQILFLTNRSISLDTKYTTYIFPNFKLEGIISFIKNRKVLTKFDHYVENIVNGRKFVVYLPHQLSTFFYFLSTHKDCIQYNYLEEGLASFIKYDEINKSYSNTSTNSLFKVVIWFFYKLAFGNRMNFSRKTYNCNNVKYGFSFGLFDESFPDFKHRRKLTASFFVNSNAPNNTTIKHLLILGSEVEVGYVDKEDYLDLLKRFVTIFHSRFQSETLYYKLHPGQSSLLANEISQLFDLIGVENISLNSDISIEEIIITSKANFYQVLSSAGFYAALLGRKVYSFLHLIEISESLKEKLRIFPPLYFEIINLPLSMDDFERSINNDLNILN